MSITKKKFGNLTRGDEVYCYIMDNGCGLKAEVLDYGCIIKNLYATDKDGNSVDVVLGRDSLSDYIENDGYFGAVIGRNSNRLAEGKIKIGSSNYQLTKNENGNNLHGGINGFDKRIWKVDIIDSDEPALMMHLNSQNGDEGFPGDVEITVTYTLTKDNSLKITYNAVSTEDTVINLTNHSYFNLNGHNSEQNIYNLELQLNSNFYTPNNAECMPNGEIRSVINTPFDFTISKPIGQDIKRTDCEQLKMFGGYDHNYILNGDGFRKGGSLYSSMNGIYMEFFTDSPCVQLYTGNCINEEKICKGDTLYKKHGAVCLETQFSPNSFAYPHFIKPIFKAGEKYNFVSEYKFSIK